MHTFPGKHDGEVFKRIWAQVQYIILNTIPKKARLDLDRPKADPVLKVTEKIRQPPNRCAKRQSEVPAERRELIDDDRATWIWLDLTSISQPFEAQIFKVLELQNEFYEVSIPTARATKRERS